MIFHQTIYRIAFLLLIYLTTKIIAGDVKPVNPNLTPEAKALLELLHNISGKYTLTGQHNYPNTQSRNSHFAAKYIGKAPAIYSADFGFAADGDKDSYLARPDIVAEAIKQHQQGFIIAIMWHAVPPTAKEPVTFQADKKNVNPDSLASVQGKLLDQQFIDLLTPGTAIYKQWCTQVDTIAYYLKQLQEARVPVLWRPYHEMNGDWFWWGGRTEEMGTAALYKQLYNRFINYHKLNNLIWVWSVDKPLKPERNFKYYYPGSNYFDVASLDIYGNDFNQGYYDSLVIFAKNKVLGLAEVGNPPTLDILKSQPLWTFYITWSGMVRNTTKKQYAELVNDPRVLSYGDSAYCQLTIPFRLTSGLSPLLFHTNPKIDFSGEWALNEEKSVFDHMGFENLPSRLNITYDGNELFIQKTFVEEYTDDRVTIDHLTLDGKESKSEMFNTPLITKVNFSEKSDTLYIRSKATFKLGDRNVEMNLEEKWVLSEQGKVLRLEQASNSFWGKRKIILVYDKR